MFFIQSHSIRWSFILFKLFDFIEYRLDNVRQRKIWRDTKFPRKSYKYVDELHNLRWQRDWINAGKKLNWKIVNRCFYEREWPAKRPYRIEIDEAITERLYAIPEYETPAMLFDFIRLKEIKDRGYVPGLPFVIRTCKREKLWNTYMHMKVCLLLRKIYSVGNGWKTWFLFIVDVVQKGQMENNALDVEKTVRNFVALISKALLMVKLKIILPKKLIKKF